MKFKSARWLCVFVVQTFRGNKIATEIMRHFDETEYHEYVRYLSPRETVSIIQFMKGNLGRYYWIDICRCFIVEQLNPNHVLEMFGSFSDLEPDTLRSTAMTMLDKELYYWKQPAQ